ALALRLSSPLQWRDRAGFSPVFPDAQSVKISKRKLHREKCAVKSYFSPLHFHDLHFTATSRKTGITGDKGLKISMGRRRIPCCLTGMRRERSSRFHSTR